ncbi:MAG: ATP synthase F1 subunit gamma [Deltaproteobacteria bacterium]|nr:MAG: ATP synthase F1 subunit gamma [Deltaproteobacteria bacterium]
MANLKELRVRIGSIKNTRKITAAMSRIAAARLSKAQHAILAARPYGAGLRGMVQDLLDAVPAMDRPQVHPLLRDDPRRCVWVVAMNADRGLCGGFNANVHKVASKMLDELDAEGVDVRLVCVGRKAQAYFSHFGRPILRFFSAPEPATVEGLAPEVARYLADAFCGRLEDDDVPQPDEIRLVSNRFVSVLTQEVRTEILLPVTRREGEARETPPPRAEPSEIELLRHLLPVYVENEVREAMLDSMAGEVAARRMAMDAATDNATELIADLTLEYNRERQAAITKELMEIIGGAEALAG